jgi:hypothetical protein
MQTSISVVLSVEPVNTFVYFHYSLYFYRLYFIKVFLESVQLFYITSSILCAQLPCGYLCKPEPLKLLFPCVPPFTSSLCH